MHTDFLVGAATAGGFGLSSFLTGRKSQSMNCLPKDSALDKR
jgi:hypothetical protein